MSSQRNSKTKTLIALLLFPVGLTLGQFASTSTISPRPAPSSPVNGFDHTPKPVAFDLETMLIASCPFVLPAIIAALATGAFVGRKRRFPNEL